MRAPVRWSVVLSLVLLATPAVAALTKSQQACVNTQNASWQKVAAITGKVVAGCIKDHNLGTSADIAACVAADDDGKVVGAGDKAQDGYDARCVGLDGDGQPKLPGVFVSDVATLVRAAAVEGRRALGAVYGTDVGATALTELANKSGARCQAAVARSLTKCAAVRRKVFNRCKKAALTTATTPAELALCVGADAQGKIAKACDTPTAAGGDAIRKTLAKQCVAKGVTLTVAFPQCASNDPEAVHGCIAAPLACAVCQAQNGVDRLAADCDALDDAMTNGSCRPLEVLVPAYGNPCCGGGPVMWSDLIAAAPGGVHLNVILNPASGPGVGPEIDPNYVSPGPVGPLLDVRAAGATIYGYVSTSFATRTLADVKLDIDLYYTPAYWRGAGVQVDGIFFDEMSSDLPDVGYYQALRDYVRAKDSSALVIANPGQAATQDTSGGLSGFTVMDYATAADILVVFEGSGADYRTSYTHPAWVDALTPAHFAHLVHGESAADLAGDLDLARSRKAGMIYVTDDVFVPNPWDVLATYWAAELAALALP